MSASWIEPSGKTPCYGLYHPGAELVYSGIFGQGSVLSVYLEATCMGNETAILQCVRNYYYGTYDHVNDIGVQCATGLFIGSSLC